MTNLQITVSDELAVQLKPYEGHLEDLLRAGLREAKLGQSLVLFQHGDISVWKAASLAGVSLREMLLYLNLNGIRPEFDDEEIREELV